MENKAIIAKVRKLLKLSRSTNEHEAAAATAKAMELLSKYNLSMSSVSLDEAALQAISVTRKTRQRLENWAYKLAAVTASSFDCSYYHSPMQGHTVFVGVGADSEICGWMFGYLYKTLLRLASAYMRTHCKRLRSPVSKKQARESFLLGAVFLFRLKFNEQKKETPITADALVPVKQTLIAAAMPSLTSKAIAKSSVRDKDFSAGYTAASAVPLSTPVTNQGGPVLALE